MPKPDGPFSRSVEQVRFTGDDVAPLLRKAAKYAAETRGFVHDLALNYDDCCTTLTLYVDLWGVVEPGAAGGSEIP